MSAPTAIGVDLGGHSVRALAATDAPWAQRPIERTLSLEAVLDAIGGVVDEVAEGGADHVVVAIPSFVEDDVIGPCLAVPALTGVDLGAAVGERLGAAANAVEVVPDLAAAAVGESAHGAGRDVERFLCVALGTGANACAVVSGRVVETVFGCFGDAGHVLVEPNGPVCACGGRGCLEAVSGGHALAQLGAPLGFPDAAAIGAAAAGGDLAAMALLHRAGVALGRAISTWSVLVWPEVVAVAGGVANAGELLLAPAREELQRICPPYVAERLSIVPAILGDRATVVGAFQLARRAVA